MGHANLSTLPSTEMAPTHLFSAGAVFDDLYDVTREDVALWYTCEAFFWLGNPSFEYSDAEFALRLSGCTLPMTRTCLTGGV